ncbi:MAG: hypothetical protein AAFP93_00630 [Bacteroidota bacterium]
MKLNKTSIFVNMLLLAAVTVSTVCCGPKKGSKESDKKFGELEKLEKELKEDECKALGDLLATGDNAIKSVTVKKGKAQFAARLKEVAGKLAEGEFEGLIGAVRGLEETADIKDSIKGVLEAGAVYLEVVEKEKK